MTPLLLALPILLQPVHTYTIAGTAVNSVTGQPVAKARVWLVPGNMPVTTGPDGRFRFDGLKAAKYSLRADRLGYETQIYGQRSIAERYTTGIVTGAGQNTQDLVFRMIPGAVIAGYIRDAMGEPVSGIKVEVAQIAGSGRWRRVSRAYEATADDRGYYRFYSLPAGSYTLLAFSPPKVASLTPAAYPVTFYPGATDPNDAGLIPLSPGEEASVNLTLNAVPAVHVEASVSGAEPRKFFQATLVAPSVFGTQVFAAASGALPGGGGVAFDAVPAGHYILNLIDGPGLRRTPIDVGQTDMKISIDPMPLAQLTVNLTVTGTPKDPKAVPRIELTSLTTLGTQNVRVSGGRAVFRLLPAGKYQVQARQGALLGITSLKAEGATLNGPIIDIPETGPVKLDITADATSADLHGVLIRNGAPQPGMIVMLAQRDGWQQTGSFRFDQTDSDGSFTWPAIPPGEYLMFAFESGEYEDYDDPDTIRKMLPIAQPLTVKPGAAGRIELKLLNLPPGVNAPPPA